MESSWCLICVWFYSFFFGWVWDGLFEWCVEFYDEDDLVLFDLVVLFVGVLVDDVDFDELFWIMMVYVI